MQILRTTRGDEFLVDDELYDEVKQYRWWTHPKGYAVTRFKKGHPWAGKREFLHRMVLRLSGAKYQKGYQTDHINGDPSDNRVENLRIITPQQNLWNSKLRKNKTSKYRGVSWYSRDKKWRSVIRVGDRARHIGYFDKEEDAFEAFKSALKRLPLHKQFIKNLTR